MRHFTTRPPCLKKSASTPVLSAWDDNAGPFKFLILFYSFSNTITLVLSNFILRPKRIIVFHIFLFTNSLIANETADPRGSAVELANHRAVREYRRKSHLSVRDFFWPYLGVSNTPYLGTDVMFMHVSLPPRGLGVVSVDVSVSDIGGPFRGE